ncbi:MAG: cardiolipin synthase [Lachnospiraceae bacterium]
MHLLKSFIHIIRYFFSRAALTIFAILIELLFVLAIFNGLESSFTWIESVLHLLALIVALYLASTSRHLSSDLLWIMLVIAFPVGGFLIYALFQGISSRSSRLYRNIIAQTKRAKPYYQQDGAVLAEAKAASADYPGQVDYISTCEHFPIYRNQSYTYYPSGEKGYPAMLEALKSAEKFIFMEYFTIEPGRMWDGILAILEEKAAQGVEVRVMYDDMGSFLSLPISYTKELEKKGIRSTCFNRINPFLNGIMNHRDHRKILIVDGKTAFTGGINIADKYINETHPYGYWKDNCVKVTGEAVWSFTVLFLTNWNAVRSDDDDFARYHVQQDAGGPSDGFVAPYGETPLDDELLGQSVYMNIINQARHYVYIFTPYLVIDSDMRNCLIGAAQRGIDIRLITPGIPDKKVVYTITRSFYRELISKGVKIYEFTPGFDHAKVFVCDDVIATVGTLNLDYRSLYLHFENGTYLYGSKEVAKIRDDMEQSMEKSHLVGPDEHKKKAFIGLFYAIYVGFLRLLAPFF